MSKFGAKLTRADLQVAYGRAGESFAGQLQQNLKFFLVLHDKMDEKGNAAAGTGAGFSGTATGGGKNRGNEDRGMQTLAKRQVMRGGRGGSGGRGGK